MLLYHGSGKDFLSFDLDRARGGKDFGKGIYLTTCYEQAKTWAISKAHGGQGFVYTVDVDKSLFTDYKHYSILSLPSYNKEWADFIAKSRLEFYETTYDIVFGKMADNNYDDLSNYLERYYITGDCSIAMLLMSIRQRNTDYDQYCFKTERAVALLNQHITDKQLVKKGGLR